MSMERDEIIRRFIDDKRAELLSPKTISSYVWALGYLPAPVFCSPDRIKLVYREGAGTLATESLRDIDRVFRTFYRWAEAHDMGGNPMPSVRKPRAEHVLARIFSDSEIVSICAACGALRDQAMIGLALGAGLRIAEIASASWRDFEPAGQVKVLGKGRKDRIVYFDLESALPFRPSRTLGQLFSQLRHETGGHDSPWQGGKGSLTYDGCMQVFRRVVERAGIKGKRIGPHTFRHTYAVLYLRAGGSLWSLQKLLGHEDIATTMIYAEMSGRFVQEDVRKTRMFTVIRPDGSERAVEVAG